MSIFENDKNYPTYRLKESVNNQIMTELKHGFNAVGFDVPNFRRENANNMLKGFGINTDDRFFLIQKACEYIKKDKPHLTMNVIGKHVDLTGTYMVYSTLLTGTPNKE